MEGALSSVPVLGYLAVGVISAVIGLAVVLTPRFLQTRAFLRPIGGWIADFQPDLPETTLDRIRRWVVPVLGSLPDIAEWPVVYLATWGVVDWSAIGDLTDESALPFNSRAAWALRVRVPLALMQSACLLLVAALVAVLVWVSGHYWYLRFAAYVVIVAVLADQLRFAINPIDLRKELRRTLGKPLLFFALIALAYLAALSIAAYVLVGWHAGVAFRWDALFLEAVQIYRHGQWTSIWQSVGGGATAVLIAAASAAVVAGLVRQVPMVWRGQRADDDRVDLAIKLLLAGRVDDAKRWLYSAPTVRDRDKDPPADANTALGMLELYDALDPAKSNGEPKSPSWGQESGSEKSVRAESASRHFNKALEYAKGPTRIRREKAGAPDFADDSMVLLLHWAAHYRDDQLYARVVNYLLEAQLSDPALACASMGVPRATQAGACCPARITTASHPLTVAAFEARAHRWRQMTEILKTKPLTPEAEAVNGTLSAYAHVVLAANDNDSVLRRVAAADTLLRLCQVERWPIDRFPMWLTSWLSYDIAERLRMKRIFVKPGSEKQLREQQMRLIRCDTIEQSLSPEGVAGSQPCSRERDELALAVSQISTTKADDTQRYELSHALALMVRWVFRAVVWYVLSSIGAALLTLVGVAQGLSQVIGSAVAGYYVFVRR